MIDNIPDVDVFEQKCVIIKVLLHSERLKQYMVIIGLNQLLGNSALYEHICLETSKKIQIIC